MIRLICSDIDGTLIPYGEMDLSEELFPLIRECKKKGIVFAIASGRQLTSLQKLFAPVLEDLYFICENGSVVFDGAGNLIHKMPMDRETAEAIGRDFWENSDGIGEVMFSGENMSYLLSRDLGMHHRIHQIGNRHRIISDVSEIEEEIVKTSAYFYSGCEPFAPRFCEKWAAAHCAVAGPFWIDSMIADKGTGVKALCDHLQIDPSEVMAFGDNDNDIQMLDFVGMPYIMDASKQALRDRYPMHTPRPEDVLRKVVNE